MAANPSSPSAGGDMSSSPSPPPVRLAAAQAAAAIQPSSPRYFFSSLAGTNASPQRRIAIAVDLSDESAFAVQWAVQNYLRPGDAVVLLHVRLTSVLYGADWGSIPVSVSDDAAGAEGEDAPPAAAEGAEAASVEELQKKREEDFDAFTSTKAQDLAQPLVDAQIPFKIHVVKDHDMKERLCLEAERLGLSAMIMGSRGFGASRKGGRGRLGSVSDYCVHHCVCPVVVVRYPDDAAGAGGEAAGATDELHTVPEDEPVYHDAPEVHKVASHHTSSSTSGPWLRGRSQSRRSVVKVDAVVERGSGRRRRAVVEGDSGRRGRWSKGEVVDVEGPWLSKGHGRRGQWSKSKLWSKGEVVDVKGPWSKGVVVKGGSGRSCRSVVEVEAMVEGGRGQRGEVVEGSWLKGTMVKGGNGRS